MKKMFLIFLLLAGLLQACQEEIDVESNAIFQKWEIGSQYLNDKPVTPDNNLVYIEFFDDFTFNEVYADDTITGSWTWADYQKYLVLTKGTESESIEVVKLKTSELVTRLNLTAGYTYTTHYVPYKP